jgi:hypothetical protein
VKIDLRVISAEQKDLSVRKPTPFLMLLYGSVSCCKDVTVV